jgi:hypothetical protein
MSYFQLAREILTSSTWAEGSPESVKLWIYLLLSADVRTGIVREPLPAMALRCGLPLDATRTALEWLAQPDPSSRTRRDDGRRIRIGEDGAVTIVNYLAYRDRDYSTERVRRWRARKTTKKGGRR